MRYPVKRGWSRTRLRLLLFLARDRLKMLRREKLEYILVARQLDSGVPERCKILARLTWLQGLERKAADRVKTLEKQLGKA